jgi:protein-S-isoprenylcysteine O-methyltransferase Ste14
MADATDNSNVIVHPPIAWGLAFVAGLGLGWIYPLAFLPTGVPGVWVGGGVFAVGFVLAISAIISFRKGDTPVQTHKPTRGIVTRGPYRFTRNPIYIGMFLGQTGLAIGFDNLWMLITLVPFYLVIRFGVVAREEAYLERKFGESYLSYKKRVGRWI